MTPEERELVLRLALRPDAPGGRLDSDEFLEILGVTDGAGWAREELAEAVSRRDGDAVELALIAIQVFGSVRTEIDFETLERLAFADWHTRHEDVARYLDERRTLQALPAFRHLATWVPDYLEWDDNRALALKAAHGLGHLLPDRRAADALAELLRDTDPAVREAARHRLETRT